MKITKLEAEEKAQQVALSLLKNGKGDLGKQLLDSVHKKIQKGKVQEAYELADAI